MPHIIQGLFFQDHSELELGYKKGEAAVFINQNLTRFMFAGAIWHNGVELVGFVDDSFGTAKLSCILLLENEIVFEKVYTNRTDVITYHLTKRDGDSWVGTYSGKDTGTGLVRCMLTKVDDSFFSVDAIMEVLGTSKAFVPPPDSE